jgi:hypothetical protein
MEAAKDRNEIDPIEWSFIADLAAQSRSHAASIGQALATAAKEDPTRSGARSYERYSLERNSIYKFEKQLLDVENLARSDETRLSNLPALLLVGDAGKGKTHLFCDVVTHRLENGLPTLLLLGREFRGGDPWSQLVQRLGLNLTKDEFLQALDAVSQATRSRALVFIDALNESEDRTVWKNRLAGMLTNLFRYARIGLAVSVRTSYERTVVPKGLIPDRLVRQTHHGFADHEFQATRTFFDHYGIERPSVPLLVPEFQNPLFLKLFCEGLSNRSLTRVPSGLQGITAVFDFFVESVNEKLAAPEFLDFDESLQPVQKAVRELSRLMANRGSTWLPRDKGREVINRILPRDGLERSLFRHLLSEGVLAESLFLSEDDVLRDSIHFAYERFSDHLLAQHLLEEHLDRSDPSQSFSADQPLGALVEDERACWRNRGLIEALSVQIPENIGKELVEVAPGTVEYRPACEAFIDSLVWRDPASITEATLHYVTQCLDRQDILERFLDVLLTLSTRPDHPYNADFLHERLMRDSLAERDAWWSIFLHFNYSAHGAVDRIVDWAWSPEDKDRIEDEAVRLCGVALAWFLTSSNRFVRDLATKALVNLFAGRIHVLRQLIPKFLKVDDPYVLERLFCVAYGCAMRSTDDPALGELAQDVYSWVFKHGDPPPHILLRDYARGVVELALHQSIELDIDVDKVRPPYGSEWPNEIPSEEELEKYGEVSDGMADEEWARVNLYHSVMSWGDFARYVIGTNSGGFPWSSRRLNEPKEPTAKERYDLFVESLTESQGRAWERYESTARFDLSRALQAILDMERSGQELTGEESDEGAAEEFDTIRAERERVFKNTLGKKKLMVFEKHIVPYLENRAQYRDELRFDLSIAQRWILQKVLDMGWTVQRFGDFDRFVNWGNMREARKAERIGKKYQWIAYHEFLARVADNFEFRGDLWSEGDQEYDGPWQGHFRDIDPSVVLRKTGQEAFRPHTNTWWFPVRYDAWASEHDDKSWLRDTEDLPSVEPLIEIVDPDDGSRWLTMESFYKWEQPTPPEEERFDVPRKEIWYILKSYIVKKSNIEEVFGWAKQQNFLGRWMPESLDLHSVYLGELFWSPAYKHRHSAYHGYEGWTRGDRAAVPRNILATTEEYVWEPGFDCSIEDLSVNVYLPCDWLAERMDVRWSGTEGHYQYPRGKLVALDPSVTIPGPGALLLRKDDFVTFLDENGYAILWTLLGEKNILGAHVSGEDWKGRLEISGAYILAENQVDGAVTTHFS